MQNMTAKLETVTPLFLGGAEPRGGPPELRPASFRGAMRYWLRAAVGDVLGKDIKKIKEVESSVFGNADEKIGGASPLIVRLSGLTPNRPIKYDQKNMGDSRKVTKFDRKDVWQASGRNYLYWSMNDLLFVQEFH